MWTNRRRPVEARPRRRRTEDPDVYPACFPPNAAPRRASADSERLVERVCLVNGWTTRPLRLINCAHGRDLDRGLAPTRTQPPLRGSRRAARSAGARVEHGARRALFFGNRARPPTASQPDLRSPGDGGPPGPGLRRCPPRRRHLPSAHPRLRGVAAEAARATAP